MDGITNEDSVKLFRKARRSVVLLDNVDNVLPHGKPDDYVFTWKGELITDAKFDWIWKCYRRESGTNVSPHRLRHGFATLLYESGVDALAASRMMGHTTQQMTELYTHISQSTIELSKKRIESKLRNEKTDA